MILLLGLLKMTYLHNTTTLLFILVFLGSSNKYVTAFLSSDSVTLTAATMTSSSTSSLIIRRTVKEASFGMGCFWEPAEELKKVDGVIDTISGYTGNQRFDEDPSKKLPSYENVCYGRDWVEAVRVTYDDTQISYKELLDVFFEKQKPQPRSRQYSSMIFPRDEEQYTTALTWYEHNKEIDRKRDSDGFQSAWTIIEYPRTKFYSAEGYHQRYWEKQRPRFGLILVLLAISVGLVDPLIANNIDLKTNIRTIANGATVVIGLALALERLLDSTVVELD